MQTFAQWVINSDYFCLLSNIKPGVPLCIVIMELEEYENWYILQQVIRVFANSNSLKYLDHH